MTVQPLFLGFACYQFAMLGVVEATVDSDDEKNRLCPPIRYWDADTDSLSALLASIANAPVRAAHAALAGWMQPSRLNPLSGIATHANDPGVIDAGERIKRFGAAAAGNLVKLLGLSTGRNPRSSLHAQTHS